MARDVATKVAVLSERMHPHLSGRYHAMTLQGQNHGIHCTTRVVIVEKNGETTLETRRLGRSELRVTALGLGGAGFGGSSYGDVSDEEAVEAVRAAIDGGIK